LKESDSELDLDTDPGAWDDDGDDESDLDEPELVKVKFPVEPGLVEQVAVAGTAAVGAAGYVDGSGERIVTSEIQT